MIISFTILMDLDAIQLRNTNHYLLINKSTKKALYINHQAKNIEKQHVSLQDPNQETLGQIWMCVEVSLDKYPGMYEISHALSALALTNEKDYMSLKPGKWKSNQLYYLHRHNPLGSPNQFWIRESKQSDKSLICEKDTVCMKTISILSDESIWELVLVHKNPIINRSCYIQYAHSSMVLDVPKASDKPGTTICQYPFNNRFNQRWNITKFGDCYKIQNLKTSLCLDIQGESKKSGTPIIQWKFKQSLNQLWKIFCHDKNMYRIYSALNPNLFITVKNHSLTEGASIVTTNNANQSCWKIIGYIPN